ncbi:uncharacterized protein Tco025E_03178 [Trypanosoma conorhini]|uniref:MFS transporter n=1 Tax=Trypanosoma conorhini TaxID=83891 RepID=A0A3R7NHM8_9TRYP|nr:uncharacterized protein Tco025E_03178 [Trypanosoma conorhini]RNF22246.1 hypothetical protein Tco025E_03178 [Trypanosoma conorhini]
MSEGACGRRHRRRTLRGDWAALHNPNVRRVLAFCFIDGACFSLWYSQVFQILINRLSGDTTVGWLSATSGAAQMAGALIAGFAVGLPRQTLIRLGAFSGMVAAALSLFGVSMLQVHVFFFSAMLWGLYSGMVSTGTEALFADSIETGRRDFAYNLKWVNQTLCDCVGSAASLVMLLRLGNEWDVSSLQMLMYTGVSLHPVAQLALFTLKDKYALEEYVGGHASQHVVASDAPEAPGPGKEATTPSQTSSDPLTSSEGVSSTEHPLLAAPDTQNPAEAATLELGECAKLYEAGVAQREAVLARLALRSARKERAYLAAQEARNPAARAVAAAWHHATAAFEWSAVPYLVCLFDFLVAVGSGMTMRYIPLFFVNDYHVSPVVLMSVYIAISVTTAAISTLVRYLGAHYVSRVAAVFSVRLVGTTLLLLMGLTHLNLYILLPIFVLRNALMNSTRGVTRSVIMDCVSKSSRAKWSAFESFSSLTWAGSAVIGGYIAEAKGYQYTFVVTAVFHYVALLGLAPALYGAREVERAQRERRWREDAEEKGWKRALRRLGSTGAVSPTNAIEERADPQQPAEERSCHPPMKFESHRGEGAREARDAACRVEVAAEASTRSDTNVASRSG